MPLFQYKGVNSKGQTRSGNLDAANIADLEQRLQRMGLDLVSCRLRNQAHPMLGVRKVRRIDLINFCFHMEQLIQAGVPLLEGLADLRDSMDHPRFREVIANLIDEVEGGKTLSGAMAEHPAVFDVLFVNLIKAGEVTGQLGEIFASLTKTIKWQDELAAKTKMVLIFPAFVGTLVFGVTFFIMIYLVPKLMGFIKEMGGELPFHTRLLIAVSGFCVDYWYAILILPLAVFFGIRVLAGMNPHVRYVLDGLKMRIWLLGPVLKKIMLSRFANFFAMMYAAGIPVLQCLEISEGIVGNMVIREALQEVGANIRDGVSITSGFENSGLFPPLVVRMLKVGESTGALDHALLNVSYFYDRDIKEAIGKVQVIIEPAMTVVVGLILGWVMLSVLGPIYDMISKIKM